MTNKMYTKYIVLFKNEKDAFYTYKYFIIINSLSLPHNTGETVWFN